ncbi:hypothetical protein SAMN04488104_10126 [Algoriphagus faecimaris]|uniref:DUF3052 domain-containing protein n=1 Tax=Algoriphagus faecimaris TaxID=686796 RepID=A0A1G6RBC5_9BACT|nr:hypothetical protein [Algoriphagus faecimaris]SDD01196.1 hypothetical protein SAMN04488104_10126 [Algoriphagus faecimaris]
MDSLLKKMNFKEGMKIQIWNLPAELQDLSSTWRKSGMLAADSEKPDFLLAFVQSEQEINELFPLLQKMSDEDELLWMAYPKGSSKKYKVKINRDSGWGIAGKYDFEVVRQIAIDEDWSALRFRRLKFIKTLNRKFSTKDQ